MLVIFVSLLICLVVTEIPDVNYYVTVGVYLDSNCAEDSLMYYVGAADDQCWGGGGSPFYRFLADEMFTVYKCTTDECGDCESSSYELDTCVDVSDYFPVPAGSFMKATKVVELNELNPSMAGKPVELFYFDDDCLFVKYFISFINACEHIDEQGKPEMYYQKVCENDLVVRKFYNATEVTGCYGTPMMTETNPETVQCLEDEGKLHKETCHLSDPVEAEYIVLVEAFGGALCDAPVAGYFGILGNSCMKNDEDRSMKFIINEVEESMTGFICNDQVCSNCTEIAMGQLGECGEIPDEFHAPFNHAKISKLPYSTNLIDELTSISDDVEIKEDWVIEASYLDTACLYFQSFTSFPPECQLENDKPDKAVLRKCYDEVPTKKVYNVTETPNCVGTPIWTHNPPTSCTMDEYGGKVSFRRHFCGSMLPQPPPGPEEPKNYMTAEVLESCDAGSPTKGFFTVPEGKCLPNDGDVSFMYFKEMDGNFVAGVCYDPECDEASCQEFVISEMGDCATIPTVFGAPYPMVKSHKKLNPSGSISLLEAVSEFQSQMGSDWTINLNYFGAECDESKISQAWASPPECEVKEEENVAYLSLCGDCFEENVVARKVYNLSVSEGIGGDACSSGLIHVWMAGPNDCHFHEEHPGGKKRASKTICPANLPEPGVDVEEEGMEEDEENMAFMMVTVPMVLVLVLFAW